MDNLTGQRFGRLTVLTKTTHKSPDGKYLWRCICDCGNEKLATAANLKKGSVKSCGCLLRESKVSVGEKYGKLTVLARVENKGRDAAFLCECECGMQKEYPAMWLLQGRVKSCGCSRGTPPVDLTGKRFGHVVALRPTDRRDGKSVVWECQCDCGNLTYRTHSSLRVSGGNTSCGCLQSELSREGLNKAIHRVDDTVVERLETKKLQSNNKSGVRGVFYYAREEKWRAVIGFQKKTIFLGDYDTLEEAAAARKRAEAEIYEPFLERVRKNGEREVG